MTFKIEELEINGNSHSNDEQIRTRKIFEVLKEKAIAREYLSEYEKEFFYMGVKYSLLEDGNIEDYECCDNPKFKFLYLVYARNINGFKKSKITKPIRNFEYQVKRKEIKEDLYYLNTKANEWRNIIRTNMHSDEFLHQTAKEAREEIKELKKLPKYKNNIQGIYTPNFIAKEKAIILHTKWLYCVGLEIFESLNPKDFVSEINGIKIVFNEFSLIHILNRHFAKILKQFNTKKSFHKEIFIPRILSSQIKEILTIIDESKLLIDKEINLIAFKIYECDYMIYTSEKIKDNLIYRRLNTFFPVDDISEKNKLITEYELKRVNDRISVYVRR